MWITGNNNKENRNRNICFFESDEWQEKGQSRDGERMKLWVIEKKREKQVVRERRKEGC